MEEIIIQEINKWLPVKVNPSSSSSLKESLVQQIEALIQYDFEKLILLLYRIDVSEEKLKQRLGKHAGTDAAIIISELIVERIVQKIKSRQEFSQRDDSIDEEERW